MSALDDLNTQLATLNDELIGQKDRLLAAADVASSQSAIAQSSKDTAVSAAATAQTAANNAVAVVTGGTATITPESGKIPLADSKGEIASGWLGQESATSTLMAISGGKWQLLTDNFGNKQVVRRIPVHTFDTLNIAGCPFTGPLDCYIRQDGSLRPYVDVPVYQASNQSGKAVSRADKDPWMSINADTARARCLELGTNALMISQEIWAMLCWNMISQGFQPRGNTEFGQSHSHINEFGRRTDGRVPNDRAGNATILTGSGPMEWSHDGTLFGIMDLVGNVWEWVDGMKMVNGQFIVAEYTGQPEAEWVASGTYISDTGQFTNTPPTTLNSGNQVWGNMPKAAGYAGNEKLQRLIIEPIECTKHLVGRFYWNLEGERFSRRGGNWSDASNAGPAALHCNNPRSSANSILGFRAAFVS